MSKGSNYCLDLNGEDGTNGNAVNIWECNGHESQLWFFDAGWFQIRWGGDMEKCLDAGDLHTGSRLMIWDCNGNDQQMFGYDGDAGTIFSLYSQADASLCVDLPGCALDDGTNLWLWDCNDQPAQQWTIQSGITIRPVEDYALCLDLPGGNAGNGVMLWMWECNGSPSQYWIFEANTYQLKFAGDWNYCIDAGDVNGGQQLMLWECNGSDQQYWGYDPDMSTMYLAANNGDASVCMDLNGGELKNGAIIQTWSCNGCWNQEWQAWGPLSEASRSSASQGALASPRVSVTDDCPALPGPSPGPPSPGPPTPGPPSSGQFCWDEQQGWPKFNSQSDLQSDQGWSAYFQAVYGEVPSDGYPICVGSFQLIYLNAAKQAGISLPSIGGSCPSSKSGTGELYSFGQSLWSGGGGMDYHAVSIWHGANRQAVPSNTWAEITHSRTSQEKHGAWYYYMQGSGVWFYMGNTWSAPEHKAAAVEFLGSSSGCASGNECDNLMNSIFLQACSSGVQSVQFLEHEEADWNSCSSTTTSLAHEIVDACGIGAKTCGSDVSSGWKAGWNAGKDCSCSESAHGNSYNCRGFIPDNVDSGR